MRARHKGSGSQVPKVEIWCVCNHEAEVYSAGSPAWVVSGWERKPAKASMSRSSAPMLKIPCLKAH